MTQSLRNFATIPLALIFCMLLGGCTNSVTPTGWRGTVEKYIEVEGKGDPGVLRGVTWPASRRSFSVIGADLPRESQDAKGLLLSVEQINGRPWFVFIVGIVNREVVESIHVEALSAQGNSHLWKSSADNSRSSQAYKDYYDRLWKQRFPGRPDAPAQYTNFPKEQDAFTVTQEIGGKVGVTHALSGARWEVVVDPKAPAPQQAAPPTSRPIALVAKLPSFP